MTNFIKFNVQVYSLVVSCYRETPLRCTRHLTPSVQSEMNSSVNSQYYNSREGNQILQLIECTRLHIFLERKQENHANSQLSMSAKNAAVKRSFWWAQQTVNPDATAKWTPHRAGGTATQFLSSASPSSIVLTNLVIFWTANCNSR